MYTVNSDFYKDIPRRLHESIRKKRPKLGTEQSWVLFHRNAPAHRSLLFTDFFEKMKTRVLSHPPYFPELTPCDFGQFPELERGLQNR
ncbi:putative mariner transposase [Trichonephila clavipes]|nr:putative mariner transposase [Trichonephila clavipes]